jgi:hypothetical protein
MSAVQARFDETLSRADDLLRERLRREQAELERQDAEREREAVEKARADSERRRQIAERYDPAFQSFGTETPAPRDDESPFAFRRRLFARLVRKLPDSHDLAEVRADELTGQAMTNLEAMLLEAAKAEAQRPSQENLPPSGELISRNRVDSATGERSVEWFGKESFIRGMGRPGRRVLRLMDPKTGSVLLGQPFSKAG